MSEFNFEHNNVQRPFEHMPDMSGMAPDLLILDEIVGSMQRRKLPDFQFNGSLDSQMAIELLKRPNPENLDDLTAIETLSLLCRYIDSRLDLKTATVQRVGRPVLLLDDTCFENMSMVDDGLSGVVALVIDSMANYASMDGRYQPNLDHWSKIGSVVSGLFEEELPPDA